MSYIGKRIEGRGLSVKEGGEEREEEVGHSGAKRKRRRSGRREGGVLERKGFRREGSRLGELDFLKRSRLILHSKELNINPSSLGAKLGASKGYLQQVSLLDLRSLGHLFSF